MTKNWSRGEGSPTVYFVPGREVVAVGLARRFGVGWLVGLSVRLSPGGSRVGRPVPGTKIK